MSKPYLAISICIALAGLGLAMSCSRGSGDTPVFTSDGEFRENLQDVEAISRPIFEKADRGETIDESEKAELKKAIRLFEGLYAYKPRLFTMPFALGKAHLILGDDAEAMRYFNGVAVMLENPDSELGKATYAETNYLAIGPLTRMGQTEAALDAAKRAVAYTDKNPNYWAGLAGAHLQLKQEKETEAALKKAFALDPENKQAKQIALLFAYGQANR